MSVASASVPFSSDGAEVISRRVECRSASSGEIKSEEEIKSYYELVKCREFILSNHFHRVALQFPDLLLCDAVRVACLLEEETTQFIFILGDTSYGSCCVDEIAAEHNGADSIIHFGPSCLTRTCRLPVLFVFGKEVLDVQDCRRGFVEAFGTAVEAEEEERVLVMYDTVYSHAIGELCALLSHHQSCVMSKLCLPSLDSEYGNKEDSWHGYVCDGSSTSCAHACERSSAHCEVDGCGDFSDGSTKRGNEREDSVCCKLDGCTLEDAAGKSLLTSVEGGDTDLMTGKGSHSYNRFGRHFKLERSVEEYKIFYIGTEGPTLTNLILNYNKSQFYSYNPITKVTRQETLNTNKALRRRYFLVQKAKEARTVGILVGTLGAADYLKIIERLKNVVKSSGKKCYTVAVGKLNVPKMANFLEIDVFVLVACPENSLVDSQDLYKPVVTPFEMEIACIRSKEWTGEYSTDYQQLLPGAAFYMSLGDAERESLSPEFSLITGGFVPSKESFQPEEGHELAVVQRPKMEVSVSNSAAAFLSHRSWQGLQQKLGETEVSAAAEGRTGVAAIYTHEQSET